MKSIQPMRVAVVGGGAFGECHLKTLRAMVQIEIAGVYTLERARGEELCRRYGGRLYADLEELAADASLDFVTIATPEDAHFKAFKLLARHGRSIYVEKPLSTSLDEAREMLELSRSIIAMSGHCLRFESRIAHIFSRRSTLGRLRHMSFRDKRPQGDKQKYGRAHPAFSLLCHEIELSNAFAQDRFRRVCALETKFSAGQVDGMNILIEYGNGITSSIEGGWFLPTQDAVVENDRCTFDFENGTCETLLPNSGMTVLSGNGWQFVNQQYEYTTYGMEFGALRSAFEYMARCVQQKEQPRISTIEDGYQAVRVVEAAMRSAASGAWVEGE